MLLCCKASNSVCVAYAHSGLVRDYFTSAGSDSMWATKSLDLYLLVCTLVSMHWSFFRRGLDGLLECIEGDKEDAWKLREILNSLEN